MGAASWFALAAVVAAFHPLLSFDPYPPIPGRVDGLEGALFEPLGSNLWIVAFAFVAKLLEQTPRIRARIGATRAWAPAIALVMVLVPLYAWATYAGAPWLLFPCLSLALFASAFALGGRPLARSVLVPALIPLFAIPIPPTIQNRLIFLLQMGTAELSTWMVSLVPFVDAGVTRFGDLLAGKERVFQVIESCSGFRIIQTLIVASLIVPSPTHRRPAHALLLFLIAPAVAFFCNGIRVVSIMLNPLSHFGTVHTTQGIVVIVLGVFLLALVDAILRRFFTAAVPVDRGAAPERDRVIPLRRTFWAVGALGLVLAIGSLSIPRFDAAPPAHQRFQSLRQVEGRPATALRVDKQFLGSALFTQATLTRYEVSGSHVDVFVGVNNRARANLSADSPKNAWPGRGFVVAHRAARETPSGRPAMLLSGSRPVLEEGGKISHELVLYWTTGIRSPWEEALRSTLALDSSPWQRADREIVVRLSTEIAASAEALPDAALERLDVIAGELEKNLLRETSANTEPAI